MTTDADRLAAAGAPLQIAGHEFRVRYTPRTLKLLEDRFGSLTGVGEELNRIASGEGKLYATVFAVLGLALRHESADGQAVDEDWLLDHADTRAVGEYAQAAFDALAEALPAREDVEGEARPRRTGRNGSTGATSSGSPSVTSGSVPLSSGTG
jgi:hypothetical protein